MGWDRLYPQPIGAFHLKPVDADILSIDIVRTVWFPADDNGLVDEAAHVVSVDAENRKQLEKVYVLGLVDHTFLPWRIRPVLHFAGERLITPHELKKLRLDGRL